MFDLILWSFLVSLMPLPLGLAWQLIALVGAWLMGPLYPVDAEASGSTDMWAVGASTPSA